MFCGRCHSDLGDERLRWHLVYPDCSTWSRRMFAVCQINAGSLCESIRHAKRGDVRVRSLSGTGWGLTNSLYPQYHDRQRNGGGYVHFEHAWDANVRSSQN